MRILSVWSTLMRIGLFAVAGSVAPAIGAQTPAGKAHHSRLVGVYDEMSGEPIEGVRILDVLTGVSALTTSTGSLILGYLPDGQSMVRLQKPSYKPLTMLINIGAADTLPLTMVMQRLVELPAVTSTAAGAKYTSPSLRGFQERMASGQGYFINDSTLRRNENTTLANLLASRVPSISLKTHGRLTQVLSNRMMMNGKGCQVDVYRDGVLIFSNANPAGNAATALGDSNTAKRISTAAVANLPPFAQRAINTTNQAESDINQFLVSDLGGVEYHDISDMPIGFAHTSGGCGAVFLWTRE